MFYLFINTMDSYKLLAKLSNQYNTSDQQDLAITFLRHLEDVLELSRQDISDIWTRAEEAPTRCTYVYPNGPLRGTKCRRKIKKKIIVVSDPKEPIIRPDKCRYHHHHHPKQ